MIPGLPSPPGLLSFDHGRKPQRPGHRGGVPSSLNMTVEAPHTAPAKVVPGFIRVICVDCIRDSTLINYGVDYIEFGLAYPDIGTDLNRGLNGK